MGKGSAYLVVLSLLFSGCIGTDFIDDPIVGEMVTIDSAKSSLMIGQTVQLTAHYFDEYGQEQADVSFNWISDSEAVDVNDSGIASGISKGQANIYASHNGTVSPSFLLTVVGTENDVASVQVSSPQSNLDVGEIIQLSFTARNVNDEIIQPQGDPQWMSSDTDVLTVNDNGEATGAGLGVAEIVCRIEEVNSPPLMISVGEQVRSGEIMGSGGYTGEGTAMLSYDESDQLILSLSSDFKTSFALGTFIYLSNDTGGGATRSSGLEIEEVTTNGAKMWNVSAIDGTVNINTYKYVVILCKPASITFGYAELTP